MKRLVAPLLLLFAAAQCWCVDHIQAQQTQSPRRVAIVLVGFSLQSEEVQAFRQGLREAGYAEGRDIVLEWRSAEGDYSRVPSVIAESVKTRPDVLVVETTVGIRAARQATSTIPVVMSVVADPVGSGLVDSLAHPGGNITGLSMMMDEIAIKRCHLLAEAIPGLTRMGVLWDPSVPFHSTAIANLMRSGKAQGIIVTPVSANTPEQFAEVFAELKRHHAQALCVLDNAFFATQRTPILNLAKLGRLPVAYGYKQWVKEGALLSYTADFRDIWRRAAAYVDKVLKGTKPRDLPIEQPTRFQLVVSLQVAGSLGLKIPQSVLILADEVIR